MSQRWRKRPEGSNWGDFGPDDVLGRLNLLTPERVLAGVREVREGQNFCLSLPLDLPGGNVANPRRHPPRLYAASGENGPTYNMQRTARVEGPPTSVVSDDAVLLYLQYSTQWDSFAHVGAMFDSNGDGVEEPVYYNGWRAGETVASPREDVTATEPWARYPDPHAHDLGIDKFAITGVQGRGSLIDLHRIFGRKRHFAGYDDVMRAIDAGRVEVQEGDILLVYTGFDQVILEMSGHPTAEVLHGSCSGLDGGDDRLLQWITDSGIVAIASDNRAVELLPACNAQETGISAPLHRHCLFKLGIPLGEQWYLHELAKWLAAHDRSSFLLTAPPLRLPGAVGSPVTPVATV